MPAKPGKERSLLQRFLSVYDHDTWADAHCDWIDEREDGAVELVATRKSDGTTLAIEHTVIQPYPREKEDFARFNRAVMHDASDLSLVARSQLRCTLTDGRTVELQVRCHASDADRGQTVIRRYGPFDLPATVRTAVENKLPKLLATKADRHLLMLERDQWHVDHTAITSELKRLRGDFPNLVLLDEVWIAETHENGRIVLFDPVRQNGEYDPVFTFVGDELLSRHDR
jgi:hypothetical protein